jgi:hypothetical protein
VTFRVSLRWQNPKMEGNGRKLTQGSEKPKSLASQDLKQKGLSFIEVAESVGKTPCLDLTLADNLCVCFRKPKPGSGLMAILRF